MEEMQTRDEPARTVRARLDQLGVSGDLHRLQGWQRALLFDALEKARVHTRADTAGTLAGAKYLTDMADTYARSNPNQTDRLMVDILRRAATALVYA